jgi:pimeloyl-ACP methyl ester carboxylesterase
MDYDEQRVAVRGGELYSTRRFAEGRPPAIVLHMGPGMGAEMVIGVVEELDGVFETALPQQRGLSPSTLAGPRDVETHVADEVALLDHLGWERAWLIGHAWGGHLAMHVAVAHPARVIGLILLETLGAVPDGGVDALNRELVARLTAGERARLEELLARQVAGDEDPTLMRELHGTLWPSYSPIHDNVRPPGTIRIEKPIPGEPDTMASVRAHFEAGTLERGLPDLDLPALLIHGEGDAMPLSSSTDTAALIRGSTVRIVEGTGHFPWVERRGVIRQTVTDFLAASGV